LVANDLAKIGDMTMRLRAHVVVIATVIIALQVAREGFPHSQPPAAPGALEFEAASVKLNKSDSPQGFNKINPGGRYTVENLSLLFLMRFAYERSPHSRGLEPFEITGGPEWIGSDRFDINAIAGRDVSITELRAMLQALLADRFRVKAHYESRQGPIYRMVLAEHDKLGPQLRRTRADCSSTPSDPLRGITPGKNEACGYFGPSPTIPVGSEKAYQAVRGLTMDDFALRLYPYLGRRIIDGTGLSGYFDADFEFTAEVMMPPPPPDSGMPNPYDGRTLPSIFSVLPQQLGLRLESQKGTVEILVVDHAERPTPN
jgi:uncharacterized protein (TIGR03435 family)